MGTHEGGKVELFHRCPRCDWRRYLTTIPKELDTVIEHPAYGKTTVRLLAQSDVAHHNCIETQKAKERIRGYLAGLPGRIRFDRNMADSQTGSLQKESV